MSSIFGSPQTAIVAGWLALILVPLSRHDMAKSRAWYLAEREKYALTWAPPVLFFPIFWTLMYAVLTLTIYYFVEVVVAGDTWQFITGFSMFLTHILLLKVWEVVFWEGKSPAGGALVFLGLYATGGVFLACCIVDQSGLYLVPTLLFSGYMILLLFPLALNLAFAFPNGTARWRWAVSRRIKNEL